MEETFHYANERFFESLKQPIYLLNASRGQVVDTTALLGALDQGKVIAAGLDVLENEDIKSYTIEEREKLLKMANRADIWITPHIAGYSREALEKMAKVLIIKLDQSGIV